MSDQSSTKPYLVRAIYEWCTDHGYTPYVAVSVDDQTRVPRAHVRNGEIVLNISGLATHKLQITNTELTFTARFSGIAEELWVPISQIAAIYAKETGHGMAFDVPKPLAEAPGLREVSAPQPDAPPDDDPPPSPPTGSRPALRRVK
ncbi:MAG: ClpXP protease specificity-enhancing factor [Betaproteobacteria bacterium]|nr:ClpXP protease specificity-enhancing factor [Betaproteobacteria bacterium]